MRKTLFFSLLISCCISCDPDDGPFVPGDPLFSNVWEFEEILSSSVEGFSLVDFGGGCSGSPSYFIFLLDGTYKQVINCEGFDYQSFGTWFWDVDIERLELSYQGPFIFYDPILFSIETLELTDEIWRFKYDRIVSGQDTVSYEMLYKAIE